jgi:hypothetical protein
MAALALPGACANNPIARSSATRLQKAKKEIGPHRTWQRRAHCLRARAGKRPSEDYCSGPPSDWSAEHGYLLTLQGEQRRSMDDSHESATGVFNPRSAGGLDRAVCDRYAAVRSFSSS